MAAHRVRFTTRTVEMLIAERVRLDDAFDAVETRKRELGRKGVRAKLDEMWAGIADRILAVYKEHPRPEANEIAKITGERLKRKWDSLYKQFLVRGGFALARRSATCATPSHPTPPPRSTGGCRRTTCR